MSKKDLFIVRHAKAESGSRVLDFDRKLSYQGINEATQMAQKIKDYEIQPTFLVTSPAKRALGTAEIFAEILQIPISKIEQVNEIYESEVDILMDIIHGLDEQHDSVAIFGHNPEIIMLAFQLSELSIEGFPTCAVAHLHFPEASSWQLINPQSGKLRLFIHP
ncbi:phosphohistidine phosphatase, SixA [bacterium A37T11]|nr:phosphohistidine phosphatase, SixA [bacterium A37T11]